MPRERERERNGRGSFDGVIALRWHIDDGSLATVKLFIYIRGIVSKNTHISFLFFLFFFKSKNQNKNKKKSVDIH
jgi:hypothetical protein